MLESATRQYLNRFGFDQCTVSTVYHHYMAAFPTDPGKAREVILNSSTTGALARASRIMVKSPVEAYKIPSKEDNGEALELTRKGIQQALRVRVDQQRVEAEMTRLRRQVDAVMGQIESLGRGSLARGAILAFQTGLLDVPFSPSMYNRNQLLTARDCDGAIRFINPERMPFDDSIKDFHLQRIHERRTKERLSKDSQLLAQDLTRIGKNDFTHWPLDGGYVV